MKKISILFACLLTITACIGSSDPWGIDTPGSDNGGSSSGSDSGVSDGTVSDDNNTEDTPTDADYGTAITITWDGTKATASTTKILPVTISGGDVVVGNSSSSVEGVSITLKGTSSSGSFKFYNQQKTEIKLSGVNLTAGSGPAFNSQSKKHVYIIVEDGTTNTLTDAASYTTTTDEDAKGCIFSEGQIIFSGNGSLTVKANGGHGIASDDYVRINEGNISVTSAKDGIHTNDYFRMDGGTLTISAATDGIQVDEGHINIEGGTISITAADDGIVTAYEGTDTSITPYITIPGGTITIQTSGTDGKGIKSANLITIGEKDTTGPTISIATAGATLATKAAGFGGGGGWGGGGMPGGGGQGGGSSSSSGESAKGIKAYGSITIDSGEIYITTARSGAEGIESKSSIAGAITINGGKVYIKAYDDCINTSGSIVINDGYVYAYATNNDAIDSNYGKKNAIVFNGGVTIAHGATSPEEGIDSDSVSYITIAGGTVFSTGGQQGGGSGSSSSPSHSQATAYLTGLTVSTGYFTVTDSNGKVLMSCYVPRSMSQCYSIVSCPDMKSGTSYKCGVTSSAPSGYTSNWSSYYYYGGTASVSAKTFSAN